MLLAYGVMMLCRVVYVAENWSVLGAALSENSWSDLLRGSLLFDTSALCYLNALILLLTLFPLHWKEREGYYQTVRILYTVLNGLGVVVNLCDAVYFTYTGRRTTATVFSEFTNEGNLSSIFATEFLRHWYLLLAGIFLIYILYKGYRTPRSFYQGKNSPFKGEVPPCGAERVYYLVQVIVLSLFAWLTVAGIRGGFTHAVRPITISNANQYVAHPTEAAIVLNTPFSMIRTIGKKVFVVPNYMSNEEMDEVYSPLHHPSSIDHRPSSIVHRPSSIVHRNVVILICESLAEEYYGFYNKALEDSTYQGYTPFLDELCARSFTFTRNYANGRKSIDGMPSCLSSIPMFVEPFFLTPASLNTIGGIAASLDTEGYRTAFFHGAENGSMGFEAFSRTSGFKEYYGRTEYNADPDFGGDNDFDGMWAIWDEPFLQFFCKTISRFDEPFMTALFTASSHHPFKVPEQYTDTFPDEGGVVMHKCIRYLDHSLRRFFAEAARQPWYNNTLFVITGDHTNLSSHDAYQTDLGLYRVPVIFFDPSGEVFPAQQRNAIAQQIDIMPTVLSALGYEQPYVAFGCDLLQTPDSATWAINYNNGIYQYTEGPWLYQFDGQNGTSLYNLDADASLSDNLIATASDSVLLHLDKRTKAIIQSYMQRMTSDNLVIR